MVSLRLLSLATAAVAVSAFTPTDLISAPRRGEAVPNSSGKTAIFSVSKYSFDTHKGQSQWNTLDIATGKVSLLTEDSNVGEIVWVDDNTLLYSNGTNADIPGGIELWVTSLKDFSKGYKAASIPAPLENLKIASGKSGITFLLSGKAFTNGTAVNPELVVEPLSTARTYDSIMVRHWDHWLTPEKNALFSGALTAGKNGQYSYKGPLKNLSGKLETPVSPFGGASDFTITPDGKTVAFLSKAPELNPASTTASYIYLVPADGSSKAAPVNAPTSKGHLSGVLGASANPAFSPDGKTLAYLQMDHVSYESDRNKLYTTKVGSGKIVNHAANWDRSSAAVAWSKDGKTLYLQAEETGREKIFSLPASANANQKPKELTSEGYVAAFSPLADGGLLLTNSSIISSSGYYKLDKKNNLKPLLEPYKIDKELKGLNHDQVDEFWFQGNATKVHGWIVKPIDFNPKKKYPLAFLIHGGPQGSWANSWSTRWNPAVFANQGYVAVAINPTGSTGYGQEFTDAIANNWGGAPYDDLVKGFDHVAKTYKYIDTTNAIAAGASYGGYMINWIQGQELGRKFKALVCHDGVFSTLDQYTTDELFFMEHDFNGTLWDNRDNYERWDPARHIKNWDTPELVIHNDMDFRLPVSTGLALFNVLQSKGVESRFLNFPDENHWVLNKENSLVWHKEVLGWINKYTGLGSVKL